MTKLTILIGTYNRRKFLVNLLKSIIVKVVSDNEIVVMDAGSTDGSIQYLKRSNKNIKLIMQKIPIGQAKSLNIALKTLKTEYVCWLSDDNEVISSTIDQAVSILDQDPTIGMVGLKVQDVTGMYHQEPYIGGVWETGVLNVNQGMIRTELFGRIGYFDSSFPDYGMDADLTTRVLLSGSKVVYTKAIAILHHRDRFVHPGAYTLSDRQNLMRIAFRIYGRKYAWMRNVPTSLIFKLKSIVQPHLLQILYFIFIRIGSYFIREGRYPHIYRDLRVLLWSQYISIFDIWYNRNRTYHLVQKLPPKIVAKYEKQKKKRT